MAFVYMARQQVTESTMKQTKIEKNTQKEPTCEQTDHRNACIYKGDLPCLFSDVYGQHFEGF
jgi:hypothetical protein